VWQLSRTGAKRFTELAAPAATLAIPTTQCAKAAAAATPITVDDAMIIGLGRASELVRA
jgi:hypothetical protein